MRDSGKVVLRGPPCYCASATFGYSGVVSVCREEEEEGDGDYDGWVPLGCGGPGSVKGAAEVRAHERQCTMMGGSGRIF